MMNGVDINDNLFGTANNLFIGHQETNVLTGGISAGTAALPAASSTSSRRQRQQLQRGFVRTSRIQSG
jgi:hypothetical protein